MPPSPLFTLTRETEVFLVPETTFGSLAVLSSVGVEYLRVIDNPTLNQRPDRPQDRRIRNARSRLKELRGPQPAADFSLRSYVVPSGLLGSKPEAPTLWKAAFGSEVVTAGVKVDYKLADRPPSFSLYICRGNSVWFSRGTTLNQLRLRAPGDGEATVDWSGMAVEMRQGSEAGLVSAVVGNTFKLPASVEANVKRAGGATFRCVGKANRFEISNVGAVVGGLVPITIENFSGVASPADDIAAGDTIVPWRPTVAEPATSLPIHGKYASAQVTSPDFNGGAPTAIITTDFEMTVTNNWRYYLNEQDGLSFAERALTPAFRDVAITFNRYLRVEDVAEWVAAIERDDAALALTLGDTAGLKLVITAPTAQFQGPTTAGGDEVTVSSDVRPHATLSTLNQELMASFQ